MAVQKITIQELLNEKGKVPVLDVRSPGEYLRAHIPGAFSLPLFSDEERKVVGTIYKQQSRERAIKTGLAYFGPKMTTLIETAEGLTNGYPDKKVVVHCWRGGMRSAGVAWLLDLYGFQVYTLTGGYKSFRRWCGLQFRKEYPFVILGGFTGSGKTPTLHALRDAGQAILDLEALADHKGSVFGHLGEVPQPRQEMFENRLALALASLIGASRIWMEDESQRIGNVNIPIELFRYMRSRPVQFLEIPFDERLTHITLHYGKFDKALLAECIGRLRKRLGGLETKTALQLLEEGDIFNSFRILLKYYDKFYLKSLKEKADQAQFVQKIPCPDTGSAENARILLQTVTTELTQLTGT